MLAIIGPDIEFECEISDTRSGSEVSRYPDNTLSGSKITRIRIIALVYTIDIIFTKTFHSDIWVCVAIFNCPCVEVMTKVAYFSSGN